MVRRRPQCQGMRSSLLQVSERVSLGLKLSHKEARLRRVTRPLSFASPALAEACAEAGGETGAARCLHLLDACAILHGHT